MQTVLDIVNWVVANYPALITGTVGVLTGLIGIFMLIPGQEPEATLQKIVNFLSQFSRK